MKRRCSSTLHNGHSLIERNREELHITEYALSETTLEQIFIHFAKMQVMWPCRLCTP